jgi:Ser/Thr protein kinase RdoA (MazF antagonist)
MHLFFYPSFLHSRIRSFRQNNFIKPPILQHVINEYGLKLIDNNQRFVGGYRGVNIIIETSQGRKLLKRYKPTLGHSTITQEHSILKYLKRNEFPAPHLKTTKRGETLIEIEKQKFALFDFIDGGYHYNNFILLRRQINKYIKTAGRTLGYLHKLFAGFEPDGYNPDGFKSINGDRWRNTGWFIDKLNYCIAQTDISDSPGIENNLKSLLNNANVIKEKLLGLDYSLKNNRTLRIVIHGDFTPYNLLYLNYNLAFVLDFEMARLDWRLVDIIRSWHAFCSNKAGFDFEKIKYFFDEYQKRMSVPEDEFKLIPKVWEYFSVINIIQSWRGFVQVGTADRVDKACHFLNGLKWIDNNQQRLLNYLRS